MKVSYIRQDIQQKSGVNLKFPYIRGVFRKILHLRQPDKSFFCVDIQKDTPFNV